MAPRDRVHVVRPGDCIESIAAEVGCSSAALFQHARNAALRERRASPNLLAPGDIVAIPASLIARAPEITAGGTHAFRAHAPMTELRIRIARRTSTGVEAFASVPYRFVASGVDREGTTTADGHVEERVPASLRVARVELWPGTDREHIVLLSVGHLDPHDEPSGVRQRLRNLGLLARDEDDVTDALVRFQREHGLACDGALTEETARRLREVHDARA